ncbi:hypothetical protein WR25_24444 [Diploscapter pachys]|uniref:RRM domain-containing protein n=1 Tax=Diploscapter pachys TaxID=2018661 RepID=A0A2A2LIZ9_9BILA|nr:hypothetical protein WR25_24444 [Diploscapter pachys]
MRLSLLRWAANVSSQRSLRFADSIGNNSYGQVPGLTVYLTHVKWITGKNQLEHYFSRYGPIMSVNMFFDAETGLHRGFASVTFKNKESANKAIEQRPHVIDGDIVDLEPYVPEISIRKKDVTL